MAKHVKHSVAPIYMVGAVWLIFGLALSLHTVSDYLICTVFSVIAFVVGRAIFPDKSFEMPGEKEEEEEKKKAAAAKKAEEEKKKKEKEKTSGDPQLDALIKERDRALSEMRRLNDAIEDEKISQQIDHLEEVTAKIIDVVIDSPKKLPQIRRFMNYYLPTTLKILNAYDRMDSAGVSGDNISTTKQKVEDMMDTITKAFDKQLDALYGEEALDISTDITVMENLLAQEGLGGNGAGPQAAEDGKTDDGEIKLTL